MHRYYAVCVCMSSLLQVFTWSSCATRCVSLDMLEWSKLKGPDLLCSDRTFKGVISTKHASPRTAPRRYAGSGRILRKRVLRTGEPASSEEH